MIWYAATGVPWLLEGFTSGTVRTALWTAAATVTILGGPALFLAGRYLLAYIVFTRPDRSLVIGLLGVVCLVPLMLFLPPLVNVISAGVVLAGVVISDNLRLGKTTVSPPGPH